ncbi:hypothetical protein PISMIDRAFT_686967 [Pisolithus microcarpus 441]|uniref:Uncharacterized protein n=1 Tax=Pisolithus microcarpus 441 TaxID=765257 RepID=A0A0C9YGH2_9AGAM|nr:hypothetical protein PISMIDRAFT_686967 [Pisolithus microcarpus 441]
MDRRRQRFATRKPSKIKFQIPTSTVTKYIHQGSVDHPRKKKGSSYKNTNFGVQKGKG